MVHAFVVMLAAAAAAPATPAAPGWTALAPGAEHLHVDEGAIDLFRFDLETYRADVVVPGAAKPATAAALRRQAGAALVVNGGFFDTEGRPLGLRIADGRQLIGLRKVVDWGVLVLRPGRAAIVHSRDYARDAAAAAPAVTGAIQVGPRIVVDGRVPGLKPQAARRTAVAIDRGGRFLTVVVANARMQAADLGRTLAGFGFSDALMLDGGPSTQLSAAIGDFSREIPGGYAVPDALVVRRR